MLTTKIIEADKAEELQKEVNAFIVSIPPEKVHSVQYQMISYIGWEHDGADVDQVTRFLYSAMIVFERRMNKPRF